MKRKIDELNKENRDKEKEMMKLSLEKERISR